VAIVEMNVKFHSNQKTIDLYIAENVSKITNQHQEVVVLDLVDPVTAEVLTVDQVMVEDRTEVPDLVEVEMTDQEKCLPQPVVTVEMNVKFHSNQKTTDLYIAENVSKIIDRIR
jgi:hypothetical protein